MTKILVIENDPLLRQDILDWLALEGYDTLSAGDGAAGIEAAFRYVPDLIVCNIAGPSLDGYGVLLELHSSPITPGIPFVFLVAEAASEAARKGIDTGADDYITKPLRQTDLIEAIRRRLQKRFLHEQEREHEVDLLRQSLADEREQRLLKTKLVAMFSHDFRNPLTSILSSNTLLREYSDRMDEERRLTHFSRIDASVRQLVQMLDDMLLVMQMESHNLTFKPLSVNPAQLVRNIVGEFQAIYGETHHILFESRFSRDVSADSRLLRTIAVNLISNAIKYSPKWSDVRVSLGEVDENFTLSVQDYGIGIPLVDQARMFAAFQRGSNVGGQSGSGLGLAIVKQSAELHEGWVSLESYPGNGTTMTVTIPIRQAV